ncbi:MAG: hypothetical protein ACFFC7_01580 [Candidatus Hermodarchaeota archaeon]
MWLDGLGGLEILDISNVTNPTRLGNFDDGGEAYDIAVLPATSILFS